MVDYERGLGDLGFRVNQGAELGPRLGLGEAPSRRLGEALGAAATCRRPAARARVWVVLGVGKMGSPTPPFIRRRARPRGRESSPKSASLAGGWRERNSSPSRFPTLPPPSKTTV